MFKVAIKFSLCISVLLVAFSSQAFQLSPKQVNGVYNLAMPERSAAGQVKKLQVEYGEVNGKKMLATRGCPRCPAAAYSYLATESVELERPVFFNSMGIYILAYDANTFVSVMADGELGKKPWSKIAYANIYSKKGTPTISIDAGKQFVIAESKRLMTGEGVAEFEVTGGSGTYYAAVRQAVGGGSYDQLNVKIVPQKEVYLEGMSCRSCSSETYKYQAELSAAIGKDVYETGHMGRFVIEQGKGVLWRVNSQLGKQLWGKHDQFNLLAQDKTAARKLTQNKVEQDKMDATLNVYAQKAKAAVDARYAREDSQRTAENQLPAKGMQDRALEGSALKAAQEWANSYRWKETLKYVYLTGRDWGILRNKLTGIQTGRRIQGVIAMQHPDGLCRYQYATFDQAYNGSGYQKMVMSSVVGDNKKLDCSKI